MPSAFAHAISVVGFKKILPYNHLRSKALMLGILSAVIPDLDVLGYNFGLNSSHVLGHRGLTHSIVFAIFWALLIIIVFHKRERKIYLLLFIFYLLCTASHGLLDAMTNGGEGILFFTPISSDRFFLPWRFIQVSPIGMSSFFSEWGVKVIMSEIKYIGIPTMLLYGIGYLLQKKVYK